MNDPEKPRVQKDRKAAAQAVRLWAGVTLSSVVILSLFVIWHLVRRGRVLQGSLAPPRPLERLEIPSVEPEGSS